MDWTSELTDWYLFWNRTTLKLSRFGQATGEYAVPVEDIVVKYDAKQNEIRIEYEDGNSEAVFKK